MKRARDPDLIRQAMRERDLSFREVGLLIERADGTFRSQVLAGRPVDPRLAVRIARVLRRNVDDLFEVAPSSNKQVDDERQAVA